MVCIILCAVQITTGLDSAVAYDVRSSCTDVMCYAIIFILLLAVQIMHAIQLWAKTMNGTVLASLLQPPPDVSFRRNCYE